MTDSTTPGQPPASLVQLTALTKRYGHVRALNEVSLEIPQGAVGLLGPNGAGKTTLLKILLGLLRPTSGSALIAGFDPRKRGDRVALRRNIGYMPESDCLIPSMNSVELVATLGRLSGLEARDAMTRAHEVLDYVGIEEERYRDNAGFSTGMKQRLKLAQALVHDPDVLLFDEPTNGLDPRGRREMLELIRDLGGPLGKSILLCSHLLPDVEATCDHVVVLREGLIQLQGRISELTADQGETLTIRIRGDRNRLSERLVEHQNETEFVDQDGLRVSLPASSTDADYLFRLAGECGCSISEVVRMRSSLEEIFVASLTSHGDS